ncbi:hypothetical protein HYY73_02995 [Candidatus Woesearchaeota archaeon]|nr:hypothetical protein [Candidatus Woesearchaeota archaeon]
MADLNAWIQAQQKRGYTKEQINAYLARKGYAKSNQSSAAARLGKVNLKASKPNYRLIILAAIAIAGIVSLLLADKLQGTAQSEEQLLPISKYVGNTTGRPVEIYSGTISKISPKSITIASNGRSKDFPISKENPPKFGVGVLGNSTFPVELNGLPNVGKEVTALFLLTSSSGERYVSGIIISPR